MLKRFEVTGFKNFKETLAIDFTDVRDYKFNTECITDGMIGKMIVYGKNSVGKSNLGLAVFDIVTHISTSKYDPELYDYYLSSDGETYVAEFKYTFQFGNDTVVYSYTKNGQRELMFESVEINGEFLFSYQYLKGEGEYGSIRKLAPTLKLDSLNVPSVFRYVVNNTSLSKDHPLVRTIDFVDHMLWFRSINNSNSIRHRSKSENYYTFIRDRNILSEFQEFLHNAGIKESLDIKKEPDGTMALYFATSSPMPFFKVASSGTKALYTFFYWYKTAKDVSLLFIDEFDAFYHYELAESIVRLLEKLPRTQVILTSHNTNLLTNRIMRPDCYFILSDNKLTSFANATDRELREGHNLEKLYKSGEFDG